MSRTALKKSILFVSAIVLLVVFILQSALTGRTKSTTLTLKKEFDVITIEKKDGDIRLDKIDGEWKISRLENPGSKYKSDEYAVKNIVESVSNLHLLGNVSSGGANRLQRYGLDDEAKISIKVYGKDKLLRTVYVGKNAVSGSQSYVQVDGKKSVMIADSALRTVFEKTFSSLRDKNLYTISSDSISSVSIKKEDLEYSLLLSQVETASVESSESSDGEGFSISNQRMEWKVDKAPEDMVDVVLDQGTVGTWIASLSSLSVSKWCEDDVSLPEKDPDMKIDIAVGGMIYSIVMYADEDGTRYLCSSNQSEGLFYIQKSTAENFAKDLSDLLVKFEIPEIAEE